MATKNNFIIELKNISKCYGFGDAASFAIKDCNLKVRRGEFIMIMGPSGCGKTTLLNIIGLLDKPSAGTYLLAGEPVSRISARKKARFRATEIGFVFQSFNLIPNLSIIDNVALPLVYSGFSKTRRLKVADKMLSHFHLQEREYYYPYQLSGGQQQRVAIARSLVADPSIILADEPTGNLDSRASHIIMEELSAIHELGNTIIMVTHNPNLTTYATRVIAMLDGEIDSDIKTVDDQDLPKAQEGKRAQSDTEIDAINEETEREEQTEEAEAKEEKAKLEEADEVEEVSKAKVAESRVKGAKAKRKEEEANGVTI